ncbi:hypothetical protein M426DRAFT_192000 [Hypoxylon sp. CI-4A]|nr:hypothetical protein M426DRAFT_192000 [Hypoxylon sp. CI-4A]
MNMDRTLTEQGAALSRIMQDLIQLSEEGDRVYLIQRLELFNRLVDDVASLQDRLQKEVTEAEKTSNENRQMKERAIEEAKSLESQKEKLGQQLEQLAEERGACLKKSEELQSELSNVNQRDRTELDTHLEALKTSSGTSLEILQDIKKAVELLPEGLKKLDEFDTLNEKLKKLEDLDVLRQEVKQLGEDDGKDEKFERQMASKDQEIEDIRLQGQTELAAKVEEFKKRSADIKGSYDKTTSELQELINTVESELESKSTELTNLQAQFNKRFGEEATRTISAQESLGQQLSQLVSDVGAIQASLQGFQQAQTLEEEICRLKEKAVEDKADITRLKNENKAPAGDYAKAAAELETSYDGASKTDDIEKKFQGLDSVLESMNEKLKMTEVEKTLGQLKESLTSLHSENQDLTKDKISHLEENLQQKILDLNKKDGEIQEKADDVRNSQTQWEATKAGLEKEIQSLGEDKEKLEQSNELLKVELERLKRMNDDTASLLRPPTKRSRTSPDASYQADEWLEAIYDVTKYVVAHKPVIEADSSLTRAEVVSMMFPVVMTERSRGNLRFFLDQANADRWYCFDDIAENSHQGSKTLVTPQGRCTDHDSCLLVRRGTGENQDAFMCKSSSSSSGSSVA